MSSPPEDEEPAEPDYRFTLANERTFLAWIRTSLALLATGIGVVGVASDFSTFHRRGALGAVLIALGAFAGASAYWRWRAGDRAIRSGHPMPTSRSLLQMAVGLGAVALLALALVLAELV